MKSEQSFDKQLEDTNSEKPAKSESSIKSDSLILNPSSMNDFGMNEEEPLTEEDILQLKKIFSEFRDFKIDKENKIELTNTSNRTILQILGLWKKRPIKHPDYMLTLVLTTPNIEKEKLIEEFEPFASLKLIIDGELIQNKRAIHKLQNGIYYEGLVDEYMMITKINGDVTDIYEGQIKNFLQEGKGILYHTVQGKLIWQFVGDFKEGKRQGAGKEVNSKSLTYTGEFKNDFKHGKGKQILMKKKKHPQPGQQPFVEKNRYVGEFQFGYKQGQGTEVTPHGEYQGQWHEGMKHGKGTLKYRKGDSYEGQWANNCQHGQGTYVEVVFVNGEDKFNKYTGEFKEGFYSGKGVMEYWNGDKYEGQWVQGKKEGDGMYEWADGDYYDGHWQKDSAEGTGAACFSGVFYDGEFHLGQKHGLGEQTDEDGNTVKAMWQSGKIIKKLEINGQIIDQDDE